MQLINGSLLLNTTLSFILAPSGAVTAVTLIHFIVKNLGKSISLAVTKFWYLIFIWY